VCMSEHVNQLSCIVIGVFADRCIDNAPGIAFLCHLEELHYFRSSVEIFQKHFALNSAINFVSRSFDV